LRSTRGASSWEKCSSMLLVMGKAPNAVSPYFPPSTLFRYEFIRARPGTRAGTAAGSAVKLVQMGCSQLPTCLPAGNIERADLHGKVSCKSCKWTQIGATGSGTVDDGEPTIATDLRSFAATKNSQWKNQADGTGISALLYLGIHRATFNRDRGKPRQCPDQPDGTFVKTPLPSPPRLRGASWLRPRRRSRRGASSASCWLVGVLRSKPIDTYRLLPRAMADWTGWHALLQRRALSTARS